MSSFYTHGYKEQSAHSYRIRHKAVKKISLLCLVLGTLCVLISFVMIAIAYAGALSARHSRLVMSLCYVVAGFSMLVLRRLIEFFRDCGSSRYDSSNYQPRLCQEPRFHQEPLPLDHKVQESSAVTRNTSGAVLMMVLIILALIAGLVVETQISARGSLRRRQLNLLQSRLQQAVADAAWGALQELANDEDLSVDHTNELWAVPQEVLDPSGISTRVQIVDQDRSFDLNNLAIDPPPIQGRLAADIVMEIMTLCGDVDPIHRVDSLKDWIDSDKEGFAEKELYLEKTPPYETANRPLYTRSELLWVNGFDQTYWMRHERHTALDVFSADLVDCLSVLPSHSSIMPININTACRDVLRGVFGVGRESLVQQIIARRNERPIRSVDQFFAEVGLAVPEELRPYLDVKSRFFAIEAQAQTEGYTEHLYVLTRRETAGRVDVLQWVF